LLQASDPAARESGWSDFVLTYNRLLLHVCRSLGGDHDAVMDRYASILEELRAEDLRRLRTYFADGRSEFSTWLVVVAQRICLDHLRRRYGRQRGAAGDSAAHDQEWAARRRLVDLLSADVDLASLSNCGVGDADERVRVADLYSALESALALLEPRDRLLLKLRFEDDLPVPELVRSLGFPTRFHLYRRLARVLKDLRSALERSGVREATP
jgi:RNA polymerase sigma factor (sigma-70 family)